MSNYLITCFILISTFLSQVSDTRAKFALQDRKTLLFYANGATGNFRDSVSECWKLGGSLPSIHSIDDVQTVVRTAGDSDQSPGLWMGAEKVNEKTFRWTDGSTFNFAEWTSGQPACPAINYCSIVLISHKSQSDHQKMKAGTIDESHRIICAIDLTDDVAVEKTYLSTLRNDTGLMRTQDTEQLVEILFHEEISNVRTIVQRIKSLRRVSVEATIAKGIAATNLVLTILLSFVVYYLYRVQNSYAHLKAVTEAQRHVTD